MLAGTEFYQGHRPVGPALPGAHVTGSIGDDEFSFLANSREEYFSVDSDKVMSVRCHDQIVTPWLVLCRISGAVQSDVMDRTGQNAEYALRKTNAACRVLNGSIS